MTEQIQQPFSGEEFKQKLIDAGLLQQNEVSGCNDSEIEQAMIWQKVDFLPSTYIDYLKSLGNYHYLPLDNGYLVKSPFFVGFDWSYTYLKYAKSDVEDMGCSAIFPMDYFIFALELYGDGFYYFLTQNKSDNPAIYYYRYDGNPPKKITDSFTDFLYHRYKSLIS